MKKMNPLTNPQEMSMEKSKDINKNIEVDIRKFKLNYIK